MNSRIATDIGNIIGDKNIIVPNTDNNDFTIDRRQKRQSFPALIASPDNTSDLSKLLTYCYKNKFRVVPQGGNTGLVGGTLAASNEIIISTRRLNKIRAIHKLDYSMIVESGCILADVQAQANRNDRFFPVSLGAEGSCTIGGIISTNAGGINVLRYGNTRQNIHGIEVVLADGTIIHSLNRLGKDNTGYDLKQLFIGAEGTLGIVSAAALKLSPAPLSTVSVLCGFSRIEQSLELLELAQLYSSNQLTSFELISSVAMDNTLKHTPSISRVIPACSWYALCQFSTSSPVIDVSSLAENFLETAADKQLIKDAVLSRSISQENGLWKIREALVTAQRLEGESIKHDIAVPISKVPELVRTVDREVKKIMPSIRPYPFGHLGDGNIHYNFSQPTDMDAITFRAKESAIHNVVYNIVDKLDGTISAEHGIGTDKKALLAQYKSTADLDLMRAIRRVFDPHSQLQVGKLV